MANIYFEARERALLAGAYDAMYTAHTDVYRALTINILRMSREQAGRLLEQAGIVAARSAFCREGRLLNTQGVRAGTHAYHHAGLYYIQEPSAAAPAGLLQVKPGDYVLDLCASPGGKSAQLAAALNGQGLLVSNEVESGRVSALKSNLERMGFSNVVITNDTACNIAQHLPQVFDKVLVDAPCSGEGMFRKEPMAAQQHSPALVRRCAQVAREILHDAARCVKPGGLLCFSTCTFSPEENEGQIHAFLSAHSEFDLLDLSTQVSFGVPGEPRRCEGSPFDLRWTRRIYPCHGGEGHFMALLQKRSAQVSGGFRTMDMTHRLPVPVQQFLSQQFPRLGVKRGYCSGESIYLLPNAPLPHALNRLKVVRMGVQAGHMEKGRFVPAHAMYMAFGALAENVERLTLDDERTAAWLRGEPIAVQCAQNGYAAVLCDERLPLGFGKCTDGICKNHYPKGLRNAK